jgi:transcriptional regulator with XRE-family HTH domain
MIDFSPLKASGITQAEFARLCNVSRAAVHGWLNGAGVHEMRQSRVTRLLKIISQAIQDEKLPVKGIAKEQRDDAIKKVLVSYLRTAD